MSDTRSCLRCTRPIDAVARICPFCNYDQLLGPAPQPKPAVETEAMQDSPAAPAATSPVVDGRISPREIAKAIGPRALFIAAVFAVLMGTFAIGGLVYGLSGKLHGKEEQVAEAPGTAAREPSNRATDAGGLTLVPAGDVTTTMERSVTSAPIPNVDTRLPEEFQRTDATALPSEEYARIAAQNQRAQGTVFTPADPRTVTGGPMTPVLQPNTPAPPRPERPVERVEPVRQEGRRTNPVPISQPLPSAREVRGEGLVRLRLTVSASGKVSEVDILQAAPGITSKLLPKIQQWRFKPATLNGEPVEGTFTVDIDFKD